MRPARRVFLLPFFLLLFAAPGLCFTDVARLEFKGFNLGMTLEQALGKLKARAYRENTDIRSFNSGEYAISAYFKNDIPLHLVTAKESDYTEMTLQFVNNELLLFDTRTRYVIADQAKALPDKYTRLFGPFDSSGEAVFSDTAIVFWTWGGESVWPDTLLMAPHVQVQRISKKENKQEIPESELVRMVHVPKLMGLQYAETLEPYIKGNERYAAKVEKGLVLAEAYVPKLKAAIEKDPRYRFVNTSPFQGTVMISGVVRQGDLTPLKEIVAETSPPLDITWNVRESLADTVK